MAVDFNDEKKTAILLYLSRQVTGRERYAHLISKFISNNIFRVQFCLTTTRNSITILFTIIEFIYVINIDIFNTAGHIFVTLFSVFTYSKIIFLFRKYFIYFNYFPNKFTHKIVQANAGGARVHLVYTYVQLKSIGVLTVLFFNNKVLLVQVQETVCRREEGGCCFVVSQYN